MRKLTVALAAIIIGCATSKPILPTPPAPATDKPLARAEVRNEVAASQIEAAKPHADSEGKVHIETATGALKDQKQDLQAAQAAVDLERSQYEAQVKQTADALASMTDKETKLEAKWYVRWGRKIETAFWIIVGLLGFSLVIRIAAMFVRGPLGSLLSFASTAIFGVFSGGVSLVQALFDNLHFRGVTPAGKAAMAPVAPATPTVG